MNIFHLRDIRGSRPSQEAHQGEDRWTGHTHPARVVKKNPVDDSEKSPVTNELKAKVSHMVTWQKNYAEESEGERDGSRPEGLDIL